MDGICKKRKGGQMSITDLPQAIEEAKTTLRDQNEPWTKVSASIFDGQRKNETARTGAESNEKAQKSNYKSLDSDDWKLIARGKKDLQELDKMTPADAKDRRQELDSWRNRLDRYGRSDGDPMLDGQQKVIDGLRTKLQDLDAKVPLTAKADRQKLEETQKSVGAMQKDLNDLWRQHLKDLVSAIGHKKIMEKYSSMPTPRFPESSGHSFPVPIYMKLNGLWINLAH
jgi:hypothetical protein